MSETAGSPAQNITVTSAIGAGPKKAPLWYDITVTSSQWDTPLSLLTTG